jgi:hypothetical protein
MPWSLRRTNDSWSLWSGADRDATTSITVHPDVLWRVWTKGLTPAEARGRAKVAGHVDYAAPLFDMIAIMA